MCMKNFVTWGTIFRIYYLDESFDSQQRLPFRGHYNEKITGVYGCRPGGGNVALHVRWRSRRLGVLHLREETCCGWVRPVRARLWTRSDNLLSSRACGMCWTAFTAPVSTDSTGKDNIWGRVLVGLHQNARVAQHCGSFLRITRFLRQSDRLQLLCWFHNNDLREPEAIVMVLYQNPALFYFTEVRLQNSSKWIR